MKKFFLISVLLALCLQLCVFADYQRVTDNAKLFTDTQKSELERKIGQLIEENEIDFRILTVMDADGKEPLQYAEEYYTDHEYGKGEEASGILLFIDITNRDIAVLTSGEAHTRLSDAQTNTIVEKMIPHAKNGDYFKAANVCFDLSTEYYNNDTAYYSSDTGSYITAVPGMVGAAFIVSLIIILCMYLYGNRTNKMKATVNEYLNKSSFVLNISNDTYTHTTQTRVLIDNDSNNSSSGGSSNSSSSGGGSSFGGSSGKF